jgi:hypothetical protein
LPLPAPFFHSFFGALLYLQQPQSKYKEEGKLGVEVENGKLRGARRKRRKNKFIYNFITLHFLFCLKLDSFHLF